MVEIELKKFRVASHQKIHLDRYDPDDTSSYAGNKKDALRQIKKLKNRLQGEQEKLYASHSHKVLIVLQGVDTAGKDSTIRLVFEGVNPEGVRVANFKTPTQEELDHDFLWRIHNKMPRNGEIVIFNRSHYEGVLVVRVHKLVPEETWKHRYDEINDFERMLVEEGTIILKFFVHISEEEQKRRLEDRLKDSTKKWKFSINDLKEEGHWMDYMKAYEDVLWKTSTDWAPWYVVPSNHKSLRDLIISEVIVDTLKKLHLSYPKINENIEDASKARTIVS